MCSPCVRFGRERDCEYADKDRRTRSELLEEKIAFLQARLQELEGGGGGGGGGDAHVNAGLNVNVNGMADLWFGNGVPWGGSQDELGDMQVDAGIPVGGLSPGACRSVSSSRVAG